MRTEIKVSVDHPIFKEKNFYLFKHRDLFCAIVRMPWSGVLNGYVAVTQDHKHYGDFYDDVRVDVHGGLTYADKQLSNIEERLLGDLWWFGFDTNHLYDKQPFEYFNIDRNGTYRDFDYVLDQTKSLAEQLSELS